MSEKGPYLVNYTEGTSEPLTNCPRCGEMGRARFMHMHACTNLDRAEKAEAELAKVRRLLSELIEDRSPSARTNAMDYLEEMRCPKQA